jgi:uncharacterized membrane protein YesL
MTLEHCRGTINLKKTERWTTKKKETPIQKIYREVRRTNFIRQTIELIFLLSLILYMLIDLYRNGHLDFLLK